LECEASREAKDALERARLPSGLTPEEAVRTMSPGINAGMEPEDVVEALANGELRP
jgi:hypothetical protein